MTDPGESGRFLHKAQAAYSRGDYASVRITLRGLLAQDPPDDVRTEAEQLLGRLRPDRAAVVLALGCLAFFLLVFWTYVVR